jgi:hypothetical protein
MRSLGKRYLALHGHCTREQGRSEERNKERYKDLCKNGLVKSARELDEWLHRW